MKTVDARRRRWPWVLLAIVLLMLGADQAYRSIMHHRVVAELQSLRSEGYPTDAFELSRWQKPVPDKQNAAVRILEAADFAVLGPNAFHQEGPARSQELGPLERDALRELLTNNAPALESLHEAALLTESVYPVDYSRGPATLLPHLAKVKSLTMLLRAAATLSSEEGQPDRAVQAVLDSVALARSLDREPLLISQLVRIACVSITCSSLERVLTQHALSEAQLSALATAFKGASEVSPAAFQDGYVGELCLGVFAFTMPPAELVKFSDADNGDALTLMRVAFPLYAWTGLRDRDFLCYLQTMHQMLVASKLPFPESLSRFNGVSKQLEDRLRTDKLIIFSRMLLPALQRSGDKTAEADARVRCALTALAVEQYRAAHGGAVPEQLGQLQSKSGAMPADPIDGAPLRYHKLPMGYVIYSIGTDRADNGGQEKRTASRKKGGTGKSVGAANSSNGYDVTFTVER